MKKNVLNVFVILAMVFAMVPAMATTCFADVNQNGETDLGAVASADAVSPTCDELSIEGCSVELGKTEFEAGEPIDLHITVADGDYYLADCEYAVQFYKDAEYTEECIPNEPGTYYIRVMGADGYTDYIDLDQSITIK